MRTQVRPSTSTPFIPLLDASDLPGAEDWSLIESLRNDDEMPETDDYLATLALSRAFDD